jgi:hypothetical protein
MARRKKKIAVEMAESKFRQVTCPYCGSESNLTGGFIYHDRDCRLAFKGRAPGKDCAPEMQDPRIKHLGWDVDEDEDEV